MVVRRVSLMMGHAVGRWRVCFCGSVDLVMHGRCSLIWAYWENDFLFYDEDDSSTASRGGNGPLQEGKDLIDL
jgi:hypothetical protein